MKTKLIKNVEYSNGKEIYYSLITNDECIGTTHDVFNKEMKDNNEDVFFHKLSLKNCDLLFGVIDVELMADFYGASVKGSLDFKFGANKGFEDGFNKAMELNKDKLFTREDMINFAEYCKGDLMKTRDLFNEYQSIQQPAEIDVEIESRIAIDGHTILGYELDENGCLILKRK